MKSKYYSLAAVLLSLCTVSFLGYELSRPSSGGRGSLLQESSTPIQAGHTQWNFMQSALTLLENAAAHCAGNGAVPSYQEDVVTELKRLADKNRIDVRTNPGRNAGDGADEHGGGTTVTMNPTFAENNGSPNIPRYHGTEPGIGHILAPGINVHPSHFPPDGVGTPTDIADLATILFHEGVHALEMDANDASPTAAEERNAYEKEAEMLCCLISYVSSTKPEGWEEMKDAFCRRFWHIYLIYTCLLDGAPSSLPDCGCGAPPWMSWICGTMLAPSSPSSVLPRDPVDPSEMNMMSVLHRNALGKYEATLIPNNRSLLINSSGAKSGAWVLDLSNQPEGNFQPLCMIKNSSGGLFICGRVDGSTNAVIYNCSFSWSGTQPVIQPTLILNGGGIGDITAVANTTQLNGKIAVFDFTNAAIKYVDVASGAVSTLVSAAQGHPDLLEARGMIADYVAPDSSLGTLPGIWFTLQAEQSLDLLGLNIFWLNVIDYSFDGTMDDIFTD